MSNLKFFDQKKILVVAAHPDDELLGLGGTLHKCAKEKKAKIKAIILSKGITSRDEINFKEKIRNQLKNIQKASKILGINKTSVFDFPDNRFDSVDILEVIKVIENEINNFKPDIVLTHHKNDLNVDHSITFNAVLTSLRPLPGKKQIQLLTFETPSSTEWQSSDTHLSFAPSLLIEINSRDLKAKQKAMNCYTSERRAYPHPRSSKALEVIARRWGSVIGVHFAEAFSVIRLIIKN